jgi:Flp pilus assembly protein TadG
MTLRTERGAIIIQVAVALLGLTLLSAFVIDNGVRWASRGQAQNAADAGALAAVTTLAANPGDGVAARQAAFRTVKQNLIWGESLADADIIVPDPLPSLCPDGTYSCAKVDVFRGAKDLTNVQHTNYLPTFFANIAGISTQGINATATAEVESGNATNCLKPWFIPDRWNDANGDGTYDAGDSYVPPSAGQTTTGYTASLIGTIVTLANGDPSSAIAPSVYYQADLDGNGAANYANNITSCVGIIKEINPLYPVSDACPANSPASCYCPDGQDDPGCVNFKNGRDPVKSAQAAQALIDADPYATPNADGSISNTCATNRTCPAPYQNFTISPRIVPVALFDPSYYSALNNQSGNLTLPIVNIMAFFLDSAVQAGTDKGQLTGTLVGDASLFLASAGKAGPGNSFLRTPGLIR